MQDQISQSNPRSAEEDLALIRHMMAAGRQRAGIDGSHLVWWGALLSLTFFFQYAAIYGWVPNWGIGPWIAMTVVGWSGSFYLGHKAGRSCVGNNPALTAYAAAWMAVGLTMLFHMIGLLMGADPRNGGVTILSSGVIGCAFFVMAQVLKMRLMYFAAAGWWAIMVYVVMTPHFTTVLVLVLSAASALFIFAPGLYLKRYSSREE